MSQSQRSRREPPFPPRGTGRVGATDLPPLRVWADPAALGPDWDWQRGKILLGEWEGRIIGDPDRKGAPQGAGDDRHIVTIAGSRAGKSSTVLIPNLRRYPGSAIIIDPKGELARATARERAEKLGQDVVVLDPFGTSGWKSNAYNPLDDLDPRADTFLDDVALVADALIVESERGDRHWTDSAKNLIRGLLLYMTASGSEFSLPRLRSILLGSEGKLSCPQNPKENPEEFLFIRMAAMEAFEGRIALTGGAFLDKGDKELSGILSTAREQLSFLDSIPMTAVLASSPLRLGALKKRPTTIYLCLPATRLATQSRWLRLLVSLAFSELERDQSVPQHAVLFLLEEFGALGHLRSIEYATGFMAGFGVKLWSILQDLSQLKTHYPHSWETFLGNAGIMQAFGNADMTTCEYLSKVLGRTQIVETRNTFVTGTALGQGDPGRRQNPQTVPLLDPSEISYFFARETNRQLVLVPGREPLYLHRLAREA